MTSTLPARTSAWRSGDRSLIRVSIGWKSNCRSTPGVSRWYAWLNCLSVAERSSLARTTSGTGVGVGVGVSVAVGAGVSVSVGVGVLVALAVGVGVSVGKTGAALGVGVPVG